MALDREESAWLREQGEDAMQALRELAEDPESKPELRVQIYKFIAELAFAKGKGAADKGGGEQAREHGPMSLAERRAVLARAAAAMTAMEREEE